ncbi:hypothetical protein ACIHFB_24615 [Streptomyces sp. NPDC051963]|uniref:hypothetical protein n=1 Tax=Streptomyces sp. NPDC051963 TaxID=3365678 RepID=UPI0037D82933
MAEASCRSRSAWSAVSYVLVVVMARVITPGVGAARQPSGLAVQVPPLVVQPVRLV